MSEGLFETIGLHAGLLPLWPLHIARLVHSVRVVYGVELELSDGAVELRKEVLGSLAESGDDIARITWRAPSESFDIQTRRRRELAAVCLAPHRSQAPATQSFAHKFSDRRFFDACLAEARAQGCDDAILLSPADMVRETTMCNLIYRSSSGYKTPPIDGSILPGIARALLCEALEIEAVPTSLEALQRAESLWVTNAVYGPRPAYLLGQDVPSGPNSLAPRWLAILAGMPR